MNYRIVLQQGEYRHIEMITPLENGFMDYRLQKRDEDNNKWKDRYLYDNKLQMLTALEDFEYAKWLCGDPCYPRDNFKNPYPLK